MFVVAGESLIDVLTDADGDAVEEVGGSALNVAVALARLDNPVELLTQTGIDERGRRITELLHAQGVEASPSPTRNGRTTTATARVDAHGGATYEFEVDWSLPPLELPSCDALAVGGLGTLLDPGRTSVLDLVDQAWSRDVAVSYDPNIRPVLVEDPDQVWRDLESVADRCTVVKLSADDIEALQPGADPAVIAESLLGGDRTELVVVTHGGEGATAYAPGTHVHVPAEPIEVVDTVGAGDAFVAGLLTGLLEGDRLGPYGAGMPRTEAELTALLLAAMEVSALTCQRRGARPPERSELSRGWPSHPRGSR